MMISEYCIKDINPYENCLNSEKYYETLTTTTCMKSKRRMSFDPAIYNVRHQHGEDPTDYIHYITHTPKYIAAKMSEYDKDDAKKRDDHYRMARKYFKYDFDYIIERCLHRQLAKYNISG